MSFSPAWFASSIDPWQAPNTSSDLTRKLQSCLFSEGAEAIADIAARSDGDDGLIEHEIRNIDRQDPLDALVTAPSDTFDALTDVDEN